MAKGSGYSHCLGLACFALVVAMAGATQFKVGGANGWSVPGANAESYNDWAEKTRFQIGDALVFVYPKEKDSVLLVDPADYNACNTSSYVKKFADGNTVFTLDRSGAFFFISGVDANCRANEKLIVMVLASRNGTTTAPWPAGSSPPPASSSAPAPSTSPAPASPPPSSPSPPPASPPAPSSSGAAAPAAAPTTPTMPPPAPTPSSTPAPSASSPPSPPSANAPSAQGATNPSAASPPPAANGAVHAAVASGLAGSAAAGIIGYAMLAL
ncbi:hypothetical protein E2562_036357 [Oryza meyeriana var. granulata]|uniref:Phytocyanin domain-containing protein n=1 Tax=Oryza meyeriana var. granulata TaxID=110450 RepID=A0A6G1FG86_9ORYZ|nr:hypothetical protein E2562_036357 [Oryza meyeriana var. granulata]